MVDNIPTDRVENLQERMSRLIFYINMHSLRSEEANALTLLGYSDTLIQKIGW
jgi:hypothetical protein